MIRLRTRFVQLANALINESDTAKAIKVLDRCIEIAPDSKVPYDYTVVQVAGAYYKCNAYDKANRILSILGKDCDAKLSYYLSQQPKFILAINDEVMYNFQVIQQLVNLSKTYNQEALGKDLEAISDKHYKTYYDFRTSDR
jgi:tetratricopeptide (TPR) repeat protein